MQTMEGYFELHTNSLFLNENFQNYQNNTNVTDLYDCFVRLYFEQKSACIFMYYISVFFHA